jgi:hypothetical protein
VKKGDREIYRSRSPACLVRANLPASPGKTVEASLKLEILKYLPSGGLSKSILFSGHFLLFGGPYLRAVTPLLGQRHLHSCYQSYRHQQHPFWSGSPSLRSVTHSLQAALAGQRKKLATASHCVVRQACRTLLSGCHTTLSPGRCRQSPFLRGQR